jgi:lysophospholipase L1-like esterase
MTMPTKSWRGPLGRLAALVLLVALAVPARAGAASIYPSSMAATGDSITRAFNTGSYAFIDAPANSWSTGTSNAVNSLYSRILKKNRAIKDRSYNDARTGAKIADLPGQVATVNAQRVEYVTILMGANDVCTPSEGEMTSVQAFHDQFLSALSSLSTNSPQAKIYVVSIPNIYNLWSVLHTNLSAVSVWSVGKICQSMLANPFSNAQTDVDRRARVRQRNIDFNTQLMQVCAQFPQCRFDNNAAFNTTFTTSDVSTRDYFHPSVAGQAKLASVAWTASGLGQ